uniref:Uncharacterized protein n=1 Tax=Meloidogyne enterolobii TaxID=390850 RepID=A0A6V7V681_MELEN|nr:unnamed protein product [Meloidogyne enterolobii]
MLAREKQASCLSIFLLKIFGFNKECLEEYKVPTTIDDETDAIFNFYNFRKNDKVYIWKYFEKKKFFDSKMNFEENTKEYKELNKCNEILDIETRQEF